MRVTGKITSLFLCLALLAITGCASKDVSVVENGKRVTIEYVMKADGKVLASGGSDGTYSYVHGKEDIVMNLSKYLEGARVGEEIRVSLPPEQAYGPHKEDLVRVIPASSLPEGMDLKLGMPIRGTNPDGSGFMARVVGIRDDQVVLDFNHPLAGKTINYHFKILDIK